MDNLKFYLLMGVFLLLQPFFRKKGYICVDNLYEKHASCIDTYTIFQYLKNKGLNNIYYIIWKENLSYQQKITKGVITMEQPCCPDSSNYVFFKKTFWALLKCKYFISSFYGSIPTKYRNFVKKNKHIQIVGVGHGPVFLKTLVFDYPFCQDSEWDRYLVTNEVEKALFLNNGWNQKKLITSGLPRYDCCQNIEHKNKKIFIFFTWRLTFEQIKNSIYTSQYLNNLYKLLNNPRLKELLKANKVELVLGLHHALLDIVEMKPLDIDVRIADSTNLIDEINTSDLFITDYSSIFFDSAYLDHPCIFYRLDSKDKYLIDIDIQDRINSAEKDGELYNIFYNENDVINKIKYYIESDFLLEEEFKRKMEIFFPADRKNHTEKFIKLLEE